MESGWALCQTPQGPEGWLGAPQEPLPSLPVRERPWEDRGIIVMTEWF